MTLCLLCLCLLVFQNLDFQLKRILHNFKYLTIWGLFSTTITFITSIFTKSYNKNSVMQGWKWHILFFEVSTVMELIITPFYWLLLYPRNHQHHNRIDYSIHALPIIFLTIELYISNIPFAGRHFMAFNLPICLIYMLLNMYITLIYSPYYPFITYRSAVGTIVPILLTFSTFLIFKCLELITRKKFKKSKL